MKLPSYFIPKALVFLVLFMMGSSVSNAQSTPYFLLNMGYLNLNGNYGTLGASLYLVQNNDNVITFSLNANMGYMKDHFIAVPEGEVAYTFAGKNKAPYKDVNASFFKPSVAFTPYSISPRFGISILNLWDIFAGYGFEFSDAPYKSLNGIIIGTKLQIPFQIFAK